MARESDTIILLSRVVETFIIAAGLVLNSIVLVSFIRCRYILRSESNLLILILSVCDLTHTLCSVPCAVLLQYGLPHNPYGCLALLSCISLPTQLSISTLFSMSVLSFTYLRFPLKFHRYVSRRKVLTFTSVQMTLSLLVDMIPLFGWRRPWNYAKPMCTFQKVQYFTYRVYVVFLSTVVTRFSVMVMIYVYIFVVVLKQSYRIADSSTDPDVIAQSVRYQTNLAVARRFSLIIVVFAVCMTPIDLFNAVELFTGWACFDCKRASVWLTSLHGCAAPLLYAHQSPSLRHCMLSTARCRPIRKADVVSFIS